MTEAPNGAGRSRVRVLPATLANQIAAGEVVERPASVLKELLENSLDAGAGRVEVELEHGGISLIKVVDDGSGIESSDLELALRRHATSKINSLVELESVASLGFRGEALPSIASVARLELSSRVAGGSQGFRVVADGVAKPSAVEPVSLSCGTLVVVRDLFFNTPARRKFLRTEKTEFRHADEVMRRIALSRDDVSFQLIHNQRSVWSVRAADNPSNRLKRLSRLCGQAFCDHALEVEFEGPDLALTGWIALPSFSRSQPDLQHFFLNGRMVRDRVIGHAVRQAFADTLPPDAHPAYVLYLCMDPRSVDVNVHPAKHEVRFRESRSVHDFVLRAVSQALERGGSPPLVPGEHDGSCPESVDYPPTGSSARTQPRVSDQIAGYARLQGTRSSTVVPARNSAPAPGTGRFGKALAQVGARHLIAAHLDALLVIDWRQAHRLIVERRLLSALESDGAVPSKPLLIPAAVTLADADISCLEANVDLLAVVGVEIRVLGPQGVTLRQIPNSLSQIDPSDVVRALISVLRRGEATPTHVELIAALARCSADTQVLPTDPVALDDCLRQLEQATAGDERLGFVKTLDSAALSSLFDGDSADRWK